jgi:hypothetical protein
VRIADIKQALSNKQTVVPLQDGSLGILPEDWLKKYSLLFKCRRRKREQATVITVSVWGDR